MSIPGKIIQTGKTRSLPPAAKASATNLRLLHPDWEYLFFDDADVLRFIDSTFPQYRSTFDSFPITSSALISSAISLFFILVDSISIWMYFSPKACPVC